MLQLLCTLLFSLFLQPVHSQTTLSGTCRYPCNIDISILDTGNYSIHKMWFFKEGSGLQQLKKKKRKALLSKIGLSNGQKIIVVESTLRKHLNAICEDMNYSPDMVVVTPDPKDPYEINISVLLKNKVFN